MRTVESRGADTADKELAIAERIARQAHANQKDTVTGDPYITHIERVVAMVPDAAKAAAWLHDVVEDTFIALGDLHRAGISERVLNAVEVLTRQPNEMYSDYIDTVLHSGDEMALLVKLADLKDHLRPNCPERLRPRYERALAVLTPVASQG